MNKNILGAFCNLLTFKNQKRLSIFKIEFSFLYIRLLSLLLKEGFIRGFYVDFINRKKVIFILPKYANNKNLFIFKYLHKADLTLNLYLNSFNYIVYSTKKGVFIKTNNINVIGIDLIQITVI